MLKKYIYIKLISNTDNNSKSNSNKMFKSKSYNVEKASKKNEKEKPSSSNSTSTSKGTMTLKKKDKIKSANNKESPEYRQKIYPKKTVTTWEKNKTYTPKNTVSTNAIPISKKKLERK